MAEPDEGVTRTAGALRAPLTFPVAQRRRTRTETVKKSGSIRTFDCVRLRDGRIGRVRAVLGRSVRVRVRRRTSATHQFLRVNADELTRVACPKGWMTPSGYGRYLRATLAKMRQRRGRQKKR